MPEDSTEFPHSAYCPYFQHVIELIGRRWTASILRALFAGNGRFSDIARTVPGLSHRLLSERLRELIEGGFVAAVAEGRHDIYHLTEQGEDLRDIFGQIESWNTRWYKPDKDTVAVGRA